MHFEILLKFIVLLGLQFMIGAALLTVFKKEIKEPLLPIIVGIVFQIALGLFLSLFKVFNLFLLVNFFVGTLAVVYITIFNSKILLSIKVDWQTVVLLMLAGSLFIYVLPSVNFLPMNGDAGEYINSANQMAVSGSSLSEFLPVTRVILGQFSLIFGWMGTPLAVAYFSLLTLWCVYNLFLKIFEEKVFPILGIMVIAISPLFWFMSKMPYSEVFMLFINVAILLVVCDVFGNLSDNKSLSEFRISNFISTSLLIIAIVTRITSLVIPLVLTFVATIFMLREENNLQRRKLLEVGLATSAGAGAGIILADVFSKRVLFSIYFKHYLPFLNLWVLIVLFIVWMAFFVAMYLFRNAINSKLVNLKKFIANRAVLIITGLLIFTLVGLAYIFVLRNALPRISLNFTKLINDNGFVHVVYLLLQRYGLSHLAWNFFSPIFLFVLPVAIFLLLKGLILRNSKWTTFLVFWVILSLLYFGSPIFYMRDHSLYLYWERYLYPELFLILVISFVWFVKFLIKTKILWLKLLAFVLVTWSLFTSLNWFYYNRSFMLLRNFPDLFERTNEDLHSIDDNKKIVMLDPFVTAVKFYPNYERMLLLPLNLTGGNKVYRTPKVLNNPFGLDASLSKHVLQKYLSEGYIVYVLQVSDRPVVAMTCSSIPKCVSEKIDSFSTQVEYRGFIYNDIVHAPIKQYNMNVNVFRVSYEDR